MKKFLYIALFSVLSLVSFTSCTADDDTARIQQPSGVTGPQFDMLIDGSPSTTTLDRKIINEQGVPYESTTHWTDEWFQGAALIDENTRIGVRLVDVTPELYVRLYQHQQFTTVGQEHVDYTLAFEFQAQDFVEFTVGDDAQISGFTVYRNYTGGSLDNGLPSNVEVFTVDL